jgi:hypothetical protein
MPDRKTNWGNAAAIDLNLSLAPDLCVVHLDGRSYYPAGFKTWAPLLCWFMGAAGAILLFASVLLHELGWAGFSKPAWVNETD